MSAAAKGLSPALPWRHLLLALAVVTVWGSNFVVIRLGLEHLPPLALATLRYVFALLPAVFFLPRPAVPWRTLALYGLAIGCGQFGLLFIAMGGGGTLAADASAGSALHAGGWISPGLASLVIQTQVFFTVGVAMWSRGERLQRPQAVGLVLAVSGLLTIALHGDGGASPLGLALVLLAAASWACGNLVVMRAPRVDMLAFVVWASLFSVPPLAALSLLIEGPVAIGRGLAEATWVTWAAVLWQSVGNTLFGYAAWGWLLARHPAASVSPLALGVPVVGMASSAFWLGEPMPAWKVLGAALVLAGLAVPILAQQWARKSAQPA